MSILIFIIYNGEGKFASLIPAISILNCIVGKEFIPIFLHIYQSRRKRLRLMCFDEFTGRFSCFSDRNSKTTYSFPITATSFIIISRLCKNVSLLYNTMYL